MSEPTSAPLCNNIPAAQWRCAGLCDCDLCDQVQGCETVFRQRFLTSLRLGGAGQGSVTVPGAIAATPVEIPIDVEEGLQVGAGLAIWCHAKCRKKKKKKIARVHALRRRLPYYTSSP